MPDEQGNETPSERRAREKRERQDRIDLVNEQERKRRQRAREEREQENLVNAMDDEELGDFFKKTFGLDMMELRYEYDEGLKENPKDPLIKEALEIMDKADKKRKGGLFSSGNPAAAEKFLKQNEGKLKKARPNKKGWCAFSFLGLMTIGGGVLYGLYEAGSAIISAMR